MKDSKRLLLFILAIGVFGILNTEMGVIGILPHLSNYFDVSITTAGWLVSGFALAIAVAGPTLPLLFSGINRKTIMVMVLIIFVISNITLIFTTSFTIALIARIVPAFFHPVYVSMALSVAAISAGPKDANKAVSKVFIGVSAGMVLGVPVASFLANEFTLQLAMTFFAVINIFTLIATLLFVPTMPVTEKLSYGSQLKILTKSVTWLSIFAVICFNGAVFGIYSYLAEYLDVITKLSANAISVMLFVYGLANIIGNVIAGNLLTHSPKHTVMVYPIALSIIYFVFLSVAELTIPTIMIILIWGMIAGIGNNINQYWMMSSAPQAPDFTNGLFLTATNLGTTIGTAFAGLIIIQIGTRYILLVGILGLILGLICVLLRTRISKPAQN